ncbi:dephospho-CoA kinase [Demequina sp. SYSU T00192]|uniref:Dephospho-CoA kinase n=1 Tax=Demequina litoralis TaxID=3051660 RepID=A0ABT8G5E5_9MICO|nr:dephospho-CoA kinase [Demequina sp. SYSU T00192]MDN4474282.1 dephospho-CoA kinase [Demequina sp. SYSU T00192]
MLRIGLTGGIASGKSTASARFRARGARVIDHDELARRAVEPGSAGLVDIVSEFGDRVLRDDALDRRALAAIVFHDESARERLNAIVHPYVIAMGAAADRQARREGVAVIVHDIPLLLESGQGPDFDLVVTVEAPEQVRVSRMVATRGMTEHDALARIRAQATDEERAAIADVVLDGSGAVEGLDRQVDAFWDLNVPR